MIFDKLKKFDIVFDSLEVDSPPVFSSGDVVSGRVVMEVSGETKVDSLKLHAEGFAKVHWTESRSAGSSTAYTQNYSDEVEYLNRREVLLRAGQWSLQARGLSVNQLIQMPGTGNAARVACFVWACCLSAVSCFMY